MSKNCLDCRMPLPVTARVDKKFCDDKCRSNFNNKIKAEEASFIRDVNRTLKMNRMILKNLLNNGRKHVRFAELQEKGFEVQYCTQKYLHGVIEIMFWYDIAIQCDATMTWGDLYTRKELMEIFK